MAFSQKSIKIDELLLIEMTARNVEWVNKFKYLGTIITPSLTDKPDIEDKRAHFVCGQTMLSVPLQLRLLKLNQS